MSVRSESMEEPPATKAAAIGGRLSQAMLLILCAGPIAIFAIGLAHRGFVYLFR